MAAFTATATVTIDGNRSERKEQQQVSLLLLCFKKGPVMTATEICFLAAAVLFVLEALPSFKTGIGLLPLGLALLAFGLALGAGFAEDIGLDGELIDVSFG